MDGLSREIKRKADLVGLIMTDWGIRRIMVLMSSDLIKDCDKDVAIDYILCMIRNSLDKGMRFPHKYSNSIDDFKLIFDHRKVL